MKIQQLIYFVEVAEQGSINKAAEKLFVTQPNLSKSISAMEKELRILALERTNKGVFLTEEGKKLYRYAKTILSQIELIEGMAANEREMGMLTVCSYPIITMGRLIGEFHMTHQHENFSIKLVEARLQKVLESVENSEAEIGFIMSNSTQSKDLRHMLNYKNLELHAVGTDTWYANLGPCHPLYEAEEVTMEELLAYPVVRLPDDYFSNLTFYLEIAGVRLTAFQNPIYVSDAAAIVSLLRTTDAFRFGPGLSARDFAEYGIRTIPIRGCEVEIEVGWIKRRREIISTEAQEFVSMIEKLYPLNL